LKKSAADFDYYPSLKQEFCDFLQSSCKKSRLSFNTDISNQSSKGTSAYLPFTAHKSKNSILNKSTTNQQFHKLYVIEDLPHITSNSFITTALEQYLNSSTAWPVIIITSDTNSERSFSNIKSQFIVRNSTIIKFNKVCKSALSKCLKRVVAIESGYNKNFVNVNGIVDECNGDIRSALNMLQFNIKTQAETNYNIPTLFTFIGNLINHKPNNSNSNNKLPFDPETLFDTLNISSSLITSYIFENCQSSFTDISNVSQYANYLSFGDYISSISLDSCHYEASLSIRGNYY
jgi:hypothetical protein